MLNELLIVERGARHAGVEMAQRHPDIQATAQGVSTLRVFLGSDGSVVQASPVPDTVRLWTLRNHNKNSFPFIQVRPLLDDVAVAKWEEWRRANARPKREEQRTQLLQLAREAGLRRENLGEWATNAVIKALRRRLTEIEALKEGVAGALPAALERFLRACDPEMNGDASKLLLAVRDHLIAGLNETASDDWVNLAAALFVAKGAVYIDADGDWPLRLTDRAIIAPISIALSGSNDSGGQRMARCALTGDEVKLVRDVFPRPDLPTIGPTILFSRFDQLPANDRYGRFGGDTMPVGEDVARRLAAAAEALTSPERRGQTWRPIPGESPNKSDLLLAYVESASDVQIAGTLTDDEEDMSAEEPELSSSASTAYSIASFLKRTERLIESIRGKAGDNFRKTRVRLAVFRKVDPANRKVIYSGEWPVGKLYDAAIAWAAGEVNVPPGVTLPVLHQGERKPAPMSPPHVAPLGIIAFSKQLFVRGGTQREEVLGLPAGEALALFVEPADGAAPSSKRRISRLLRMVWTRRAMLCFNTAHALRRNFDAAKDFDRREVLRTITVLGVLLHKSGRKKEQYMSATAFKLGQLLAAADVVHAGYCADVRGGDVPPSLLGNQVFTMAQASPTKALATLCRRWKPYDGWAKKAVRDPDRIHALRASKQKSDQQRGWEILKALRHAREMRPLADEVGQGLNTCSVNDVFRAELLLGYICGLPKSQMDPPQDDNQSTQPKE